MDLSLGDVLGRRDAIDEGDPNPRGESLSHLSTVFVCLAGLFVVLRLLTRYFHIKTLAIDDGLITAALVWNKPNPLPRRSIDLRQFIAVYLYLTWYPRPLLSAWQLLTTKVGC